MSMEKENLEIINFKRLVIIGNGFDLAIGAKTKYSDFYKCLKACFESKTISEFEKLYFYNDNEILINAFFKEVNENKDNYFINYFLNYEKIFGDWVSFEKELTKIVKSLDYLISALKSNDKLVIEMREESYIRIRIKIIDKPEVLQVLKILHNNKFFYAYMDEKDYIYNGAVIFDINGVVYKNVYDLHKNISDFSERFPFELYNDLNVFSNLFSIYLGIVNHYVSFDMLLEDKFVYSCFITYNYTNYVERLLRKKHLDISNVVYINGAAENYNGHAKEKIVFGIDSNIKLDNHGFELFTKTVQRSIKNTDISKLNYLFKTIFNEIIIFGHSLNIADYESLNFILTRNIGIYKPRIVVYYYDNMAKMESILNLKTILGDELFNEFQREGKMEFIDSKKFWIDK